MLSLLLMLPALSLFSARAKSSQGVQVRECVVSSPKYVFIFRNSLSQLTPPVEQRQLKSFI